MMQIPQGLPTQLFEQFDFRLTPVDEAGTLVVLEIFPYLVDFDRPVKRYVQRLQLALGEDGQKNLKKLFNGEQPTPIQVARSMPPNGDGWPPPGFPG